MRFIKTISMAKVVGTRTTPIEDVKHRNEGKMWFLSTRTNANEVNKHKIKGKLCCKAQ